MKKQVVLIVFTIGLCLSSYSQEKINISTEKSELKWFGEYAFYFGGHDGIINISEGHLIRTDNLISGGEFTVDMRSIICNDIEDEEANAGLIDHLKNEDFFAVDHFSKAKLVITRVEYHDDTHMKVYADLTIKEITLPIDFQAEVNYETQQMTTKFKIDRQRWKIDYNSKLRDSAIADGIGFEITLSIKAL
ncbi:YceI family protein [Winogradskyella sp.]|uniref:YceI family protein n=1 Tax=Winogradskyella sp. TaxID=1883156 RepID=UPI0025EAC742|nr:YceI family protein [Winogradskyella sp.]